jgi:hypothetical protein
MTERRYSSSSMVPTLRSMDMQHIHVPGIDPPPQLSAVGNEKPHSIFMKTANASPASASLDESGTNSAHLLSNAPIVTPAFDSDSDNDDLSTSDAGGSQASKSVIATIESIQTLPMLDPNQQLNNTNNGNTSNHCFVRYLLPSCNSFCTIPAAIAALPAVLRSIADFLRLQSIPCTLRASHSTVAFHCARSSALANLGGPSLIFIIYLWYEPPIKSDSSIASTDAPKNIIVDVQRRQGCVLDLQCIRRALFRNLLNPSVVGSGPTDVEDPVGKRQGMIPLDICRSIWATYYSKGNSDTKEAMIDADSTTVDSASESVGRAEDDFEELSHYQDLLSESNSDENHRMGLECLCQRTDASVTDVVRSKAIVRAIVCGVAPDDNCRPTADAFRQNLLRFLMSEIGHDAHHSKEHSIHVLANTGCSFLNMHALSLKVLSNSVHVFIDTEPKDASIPVDDVFWRTALQSCRRNIKTAAQAPCVAAISMHLITNLLKHSNHSAAVMNALMSSNEPDLTSLWLDVENALSVGQLRHSKLEQSAQALMNVLLVLKDDR